MRVAPSLCMAFKGTLPSQLWLHYNQVGGKRLMEMDMGIAIEINDKIAEATENAKQGSTSPTGMRRATANDAKSIVARRNERRKARKAAEEANNKA